MDSPSDIKRQKWNALYVFFLSLGIAILIFGYAPEGWWTLLGIVSAIISFAAFFPKIAGAIE